MFAVLVVGCLAAVVWGRVSPVRAHRPQCRESLVVCPRGGDVDLPSLEAAVQFAQGLGHDVRFRTPGDPASACTMDVYVDRTIDTRSSVGDAEYPVELTSFALGEMRLLPCAASVAGE